MAKFCTSCGAQLGGDSRFCPACGKPLIQQSAQVPQDNQKAEQKPPSPKQVQLKEPRKAPAVRRKKSKLPLILGIVGGVVVTIVVAVVLIINAVTAGMKKTAAADYYEIGNDKVPSVKLALDREVKVSGSGTNISEGVTTRTIRYSAPDADQRRDMTDYLSYLREKDGFYLLTDIDFSAEESRGMLGRNSVDAGYELILQIEYDKDGYTITIVREEGGVTVLETPAPKSAICAQSAFEIIDSGTFHMLILLDVNGDNSAGEMEVFKNGDRSTFVMKDAGISMITMNGKVYNVMDSFQTILITEIDLPKDIHPVEYNSSMLSYVGEGTGEFNGQTYPCSEYTSMYGDQMFYFMDGEVLKGIRAITTAGNTLDADMRVFDQNVPDDVFVLPTDYNVQDQTIKTAPWIGLWRCEEEGGVELLLLEEDGSFIVDSRIGEPEQYWVATGQYSISEDDIITLSFTAINGQAYESEQKLSIRIPGSTLILNNEDVYSRIPEEYVQAIRNDPFMPIPT